MLILEDLTMNIKFLTIILTITVALLGCTSTSKTTDEELIQRYSMMDKESHKIDELNEQLLAAAAPSEDRSDYVLGPGDLIEITVFEAKELTTKVRVSSRGFVTLNLLNEVELKGLTAREAEKKIEELYGAKYIRDPHVSIFVEESFSQRVTLVGEVKTPGTYDYKSKQRLLDVLALAGGLTEKAGTTVQIRRMNAKEGQDNLVMVDLDRLIKQGNTALNVEINGGDVIHVPEAGTVFMAGAIRRPGSYPIKKNMNLMEAVATAGGFQPYANKDRVIVIRAPDENGERKIVELDWDDDPNAPLTKINDRDVIIARSSAAGKFWHGLRINIGIPGIAGVGYSDPARSSY